MLAAKGIEGADDVGNLHLLAVDGLGNALFEGHGDMLRLIRGILRCAAEHKQMLVIRREGRVFKLETFVTDVPEVTVTAVAVLSGEGKIDTMCLAVVDLILAGFHGPDIGHTPWCDDADIRGQRLDAKLETDLVVAFAGSAVADSRSAFFSGNLHQSLCHARTGHGCTQQVLVFINCICLYARYNIIITEIINNIFNIKL